MKYSYKTNTMNLKVIFSVLCLCSLAWLFAQPTPYQPQTVPNPKTSGGGYVSDPGQVLQPGAREAINAMITDLEQKSTAQIAVVILPSIGEAVPREFVYELFQLWGIGQRGQDNGLMLLVVMDQRRSEIETGYGLEGLLPDVICYRILMNELVPRFQQGDYSGGVLATITQIKALLEDPAALAEMRAAVDPKADWPRFFHQPIHPVLYYYGLAALLLLLGLLTWVILTLASKDDLYDKYRNIRFTTWWIWVILFPLPFLVAFPLLRYLLRWLRRKPRFGPKTGVPLHLLREDEEDHYLEKGQITEEEIKSIDYDVWVSDDGEEVLVLPYAKLFSSYAACPKCGFKTYRKEESLTLQAATRMHGGLVKHIYRCKNCFYHQETLQHTARLSDGSSGGGGGGGGGSWGGGSSGGGGAGAGW
ncbi:MAG: hypothetical protein DA408_17200 [Bacteroidetes bacterium]|nr:MAG: hypothetical protein DA408_17200 [Bacteroidota bacterium]